MDQLGSHSSDQELLSGVTPFLAGGTGKSFQQKAHGRRMAVWAVSYVKIPWWHGPSECMIVYAILTSHRHPTTKHIYILQGLPGIPLGYCCLMPRQKRNAGSYGWDAWTGKRWDKLLIRFVWRWRIPQKDPKRIFIILNPFPALFNAPQKTPWSLVTLCM